MCTTVDKKTWNMKCISDARNQLFGIATLMIVFFHSSIIIPPSFGILAFIKEMGNLGVDVFLFLSAVGLYYSFSKSENIKEFYAKRMLRILPSLFIVSIIWFSMSGTSGLKSYFSNVFLISFFTQGSRYMWFFVLLIAMYLVYPFLYKAMKKRDTLVGVILLIAIVLFNFLLYRFEPELFSRIEIATTRIPVFVCGVWVAKRIKEQKKNIKEVVFAICSISAINIFIYL